MYTTQNFRTKKALKEAVDLFNKSQADPSMVRHSPVTIWQPGGIFDPPAADRHYTGTATLEGPHYPAPHTWYAQVEMKDGMVVKVK